MGMDVAVLEGFGEPVVARGVEPADPGRGEVLVRTNLCIGK